MTIKISNEVQNYNQPVTQKKEGGSLDSIFKSQIADPVDHSEKPKDISTDLILDLAHKRLDKASNSIMKINKDNVMSIYEAYEEHCKNYPVSNPSLTKNILDCYDQPTAQKLLVHIVTALRDRAKSRNIDINPEIKEFNNLIRQDVKWYQLNAKIKKKIEIDSVVSGMVDKLR